MGAPPALLRTPEQRGSVEPNRRTAGSDAYRWSRFRTGRCSCGTKARNGSCDD